jgi:hypothetical protein
MLSLLFAILIPVLTGVTLVFWIAPNLNRLVKLGYGMFFGWVLTSVLLFFSFKVAGNVEGSLGLTKMVLALFLIALLLLTRSRGRVTLGLSSASLRNGLHEVATASPFILLSVVTVTALGILITNLQPLLPWDAWDFWGRQVKHWFFTGDLTYRISHQYPPFMPLMQFWVCAVIDRYDDVAMNFPFLTIYIGLVLAVAGQIREIGGSVLDALVAVTLVTTLPSVAVHASLVGYADLPMSIAICLGLMGIIGSLRAPRRSPMALQNGALAIGSIASISLFKRPGIFWTLLVLIAVWLVMRKKISKRTWYGVTALSIPFVLMLAFYLDQERGYNLQSLNILGGSSRAISLVFDSVVNWSNYGLMWLGLLMIFSYHLMSEVKTQPLSTLWLTIAFALSALLVAVVYFQGYEFWSTVLVRALLHMAPAVVFGLVAWQIELRSSKENPND